MPRVPQDLDLWHRFASCEGYRRCTIGVLEERHSRDIPRFSETLVSDIVHCFKSLGRVFGFLNIAVRMC